MSGPWDNYAPAAPAPGPWTQYAQSAPNSRQSSQLAGAENGPQFQSLWQQGAKAAGVSPGVTNAVQDFGVGVAQGGAGLGDFLSHLLPIPGFAAHEDAQVQALQQYEAQRRSSGQGNRVANVLGQIASPVNYTPVGRMGAGVGVAEPLGKMAAQGAVGGASSAVDPSKGDYLTQKFAQIATGAAGSALGGALLHGAGAAIRHMITPDAEAAIKNGITPTIGKSVRGFGRLEDILSKAPIVGPVIRNGRNIALESFNRAAINRTLAPIGKELPKNVDVGNDGVAWAAREIGDTYDRLNAKMIGVMDPQLHDEISSLSEMAKNLQPREASQFTRILKDEVLSRFTSQGRTTGSTIKQIESTLGRLAKPGQADDYDTQALKGGVKELQQAIISMRDRINPQFSGEVQKANAAWANFKRVQRAASYVGTDGGLFTPQHLAQAVRAGDWTKDKRAYSEGAALMQDLASIGKKTVADRVPNSGTPERLMTTGVGLEALTHAPQIASAVISNPFAALATGVGAAVAALPYTQLGMDLLAKYGGAETRNMLARRISSAEPYVTGALGVTRAQQPNQPPNQ